MRDTGKNFHCDLEAPPAVVDPGCLVRAPCLARLPTFCSATLHTPGAHAIHHQRLSKEARGSPHPQEKCARDGSCLHGGENDGWPQESICHLQGAHVCIPAAGPGSDRDACCSVFLAVVAFSPFLTNGPISQPG